MNNSIASKTKIFTPIISTISSFSMVPLPSISYMVNAQFSLLLGSPPDVMLMASRNSLKSILPLLSPSKERKTWLQNLSGFPVGKNVEYTSRNLAFDSNPSGQSLFMEEKKGDTIEENSSENLVKDLVKIYSVQYQFILDRGWYWCRSNIYFVCKL